MLALQVNQHIGIEQHLFAGFFALAQGAGRLLRVAGILALVGMHAADVFCVPIGQQLRARRGCQPENWQFGSVCSCS
jgi:hypothetical protein